MSREKTNSSTGRRLGTAVVLLVVCLFLAVGAVCARYQTNLSEYLDYEAKEAPEVFLWSGMIGNGFVSGPGQWNMDAGVPVLDFCVSNGESSTSYAADDLNVSIRLITSLGYDMTAEDVNGTTATLNLSMHGKPAMQYVGTATKITENSPVYASSGAGWVISFLDEKGEELKWKLDGGVLSQLQGELVVQNMDLATASMLTLQVSGEWAG